MAVDIDVVISGGSINGICDAIGFLKAITVDLGYHITAGSAASAGGIILGAYASGRPIAEIEEVVVNTNIKKLLQIPKRYNVFAIWRAFTEGWICDGELLERLMERLTYKKTIKELDFDLHIVGSDFTHNTLHDFNKISDPDMMVSKAMRITSGVPGLFKPVDYGGIIWFDGSIRSYFPVEILPLSPRPIYGFVSNKIDRYNMKPKLGAYGVLAGLIDHSVDANIQHSIQVSGRKPITITHNDRYVGTYDFGLPPVEKQKLIEAARQATLKKLS
jgi:predicted acylesterase/phospholipase RssA